ncbi:helix-turn-helix transcriptional regulator [Streptomyces glaucus]|uniref:HTH luxR-type domain-containing protein n=1 Tax=Streptomyces glaucus TaxID=284029 RepID=A0ABN3K6Q2_9ACTN
MRHQTAARTARGGALHALPGPLRRSDRPSLQPPRPGQTGTAWDDLEEVETALARAQQVIREHRLLRAQPPAAGRPGRRPMPLRDVTDAPVTGRDLILAAEREACLALAVPDSPDCLAEAEDQYRTLRSAEVSVRVLYPKAIMTVAGAAAHLERAAGLGVQCRLVSVRQVFTAVIDRTTVFMAAGAEPGEAGERVFRESEVVALLAEAFEQSWASSMPVRAVVSRLLTPQQVTALQLMNSGVKDEKIARIMDISPRTLSRLVAKAMEALGARSRFEAGARAQELGLLG